MKLSFEGTSRFVKAGGVRIHYHEAGTGPVLLLIHGGAPGAFGWGNFGQNLEAFAASFRTIIVDLPGYGRSDKPQIEGGRFSFYAETFCAMLKELEINRAHVVGLATGGGAAIAMAIRESQLVDGLVLVSSAGGLSLFGTAPTEGQKVIGSYYGGTGPSREKMKSYLEMMMFDRSRITDALIDERFEASLDPDFMKTAPEGHGRTVAEDIWQDLDKIESKTLILWGRDNRVLGYDNALFMLNRIPDCQVHIFGKTGLWIPSERARDFEKLVTGFVTG